MASICKSKAPKEAGIKLSKLFISNSLPSSPDASSHHHPLPNIRTSKFEGDNQTQKPKSSTKTKKARELARLINNKLSSDSLESSLLSHCPAPPSKTTVVQTLYLIKNPSKALQFFNWVQSDHGYNHDYQSYFAMLEILGNARHLNSARNLLYSIHKRSNRSGVNVDARLFNSLISSYGRAGLFNESVKVFNSMKAMDVSPTTVTFNSLLSVLLKRGRTGIALQVYEEMLRTYGVTPDVITFNVLIRGFCLNGMVDQGFRFFSDMSRLKSSDPDLVTYNTLVDGLCRAGKVNIAQNLVKGMLTKGEHLRPNVVTYTTLIKGLCANRNFDDALALFKEMVVDRCIRPNAITYNTIIEGLCEAGRLDKNELKAILNEGRSPGEGEIFIPDICTFNTLLTAHCNTGKLDEAMALFNKLSDLEVQPDSASYSILIRAFCEQGGYKKAEELFDELYEKKILLSDEGSVPLMAAYNPMFENLCANGKTVKAEEVFRQLMRMGTQDPCSYKTLIMGHSKEGRYVAGHGLLLWMLRRDFIPDLETYQSLVDGLLQKGEASLAFQTLQMMLRSSYTPMTATFHSVLSALIKMGKAQECASLIILMLERKVRLKIDLSTGAVILIFEKGTSDKAFMMLRMLYDEGFTVTTEEVVKFLCTRKKKKLLDAREVLRFSLEKQEKVDIETCDTVIMGLCQMGKLFEAFELFYELVEKGEGQHGQLECLEGLRDCLESEGKSKEAEFVLKRMVS